VEIIHTEFQYISLIEMQKYNWNRKRIEKRKTWKKETFCPGCQTRDKRAPPFVPDWRSRLGNRDNSGFPTGTNQRFCSSGPLTWRINYSIYIRASTYCYKVLTKYCQDNNIIGLKSWAWEITQLPHQLHWPDYWCHDIHCKLVVITLLPTWSCNKSRSRNRETTFGLNANTCHNRF